MRALTTGILLLFCALHGVTGCSKPGCGGDAGMVVTQERPVLPFNEINLRDNIQLVLTQDSVRKITVQAGAHMAANIVTEIRDNILYITNDTKCKWLRDPGEAITVFVSVSDLIRLRYNGSGNVTSTNTIKADAITFTTDEGAGDIRVQLEANRTYLYIFNDNTDMFLTGKSDSCYAYTGERGTIDLRNFIVRHQKVGYGSVRDGYVHATESLDVIMYFKGTLYYKGNPLRVTTEFLSPGRVVAAP